MQSSNNQLALLACYSHGAKFLYPYEKSSEIRQIDGQYEKFTAVERTVRQQLQQVMNEISVDKPLNGESLISGALTMALCYIARLEREKIAGEKLYSRILVITASNDSATQYMNYMNIFFTAHKMVHFHFIYWYLHFLNFRIKLNRISFKYLGCNIGCMQLRSGIDFASTRL